MGKFKAQDIPSESFVTSNARIMATVKTGQLTLDHNIGISTLHSPTKYNAPILYSSRVKLLVDGEFCDPYDDELESVVTERGYVPGTNIIYDKWRADGLSVTDSYFIPPELDVLIQQVQI